MWSLGRPCIAPALQVYEETPRKVFQMPVACGSVARIRGDGGAARRHDGVHFFVVVGVCVCVYVLLCVFLFFSFFPDLFVFGQLEWFDCR